MREVHELLKDVVERLHQAAASNLESIVLYGSAARGDFHQQHSDINLLCILRSLGVDQLSRLSDVVKWWTSVEKQQQPLFFSADELRASADVFAIELIDMQRSHRVLYGADPIASLSVPMNLHRIQVEHELRTVLLRLRQHFIREARHSEELRTVLVKASSSIITLLRHTLIAFGEQAPEAARDVFMRVSALTGADAAAFTSLLALRERQEHPLNIGSMYGACMSAVEKVIGALDQLLPKRHWQRAAGSSS